MTIAISVKINDGVVLATDSATSLLVPGPGGTIGVQKIYNNANKAFNLRKDLPIGAVTWGLGGIGNASISTLVKDLRDRFSENGEWRLDPESYTIEEVAGKLRRFIFEEHYAQNFQNWPANEPKPDLGFIIAGYSAKQALADEYIFVIERGESPAPRPLRPQFEVGVSWAGMGEPLNRLVLGFGTALPQGLQNNLGVPPEQIAPAMATIQQALNLPVVSPAMPLQDAIDLARFLANVAVNYLRFVPGAPVVGGPIEIAAITKHEKFKWIRRKHYYRQELNVKGG